MRRRRPGESARPFLYISTAACRRAKIGFSGGQPGNQRTRMAQAGRLRSGTDDDKDLWRRLAAAAAGRRSPPFFMAPRGTPRLAAAMSAGGSRSTPRRGRASGAGTRCARATRPAVPAKPGGRDSTPPLSSPYPSKISPLFRQSPIILWNPTASVGRKKRGRGDGRHLVALWSSLTPPEVAENG